MFTKLMNALAVAGLFVTGSYPKCLSEEFLYCSKSNVEVQYTDNTGKIVINNAEEKVAAAFRYLVEKFRAGNVTNVKRVWTTNNGNSGEGTTLTGSYPGDNFIDYISIDGYYFGTAQSWSSWNSFEEVFRDAYNAISKFQKPMFIAKFSSSELGGNKAEWIS
ncbi:glycoside hydrolase superfamily [Neocallimastix lanati (nom. inval.)]|uniref:GH26 domain-containing protein n=1 Tax=Neocallimastix californiae TaxID=1754190 RepID=A0A1Y2AGX6_9FUNG|nr:glycoside hydrolase superfamily [Neocallimastix sp. JGI-2020a]ORY21437.1 hypothetical protein LY90DRAFT_516088 [Neocallimastix californiae]|eukprot:ORY21437.1 hypothetical protein LY90DRAFT_516088 [Neocallimastix californiae]